MRSVWLLVCLLSASSAMAQERPDLGLDLGLSEDAGPDAGTDAGPRDAVDSGPPSPPPEPELPEGHRPELRLTLTPAQLSTGDLLHVVLTADAVTGDDLTVPRQSFAPFEAHATHARQAPVPGGKTRFTFEVDLLALEPGEQELPAITVRVVTADGHVGTVRTTPRPVTVRSVLGNEPDAQPKPATQPVRVMQDDYTLAWVGGAFGVLLLGALIGWLVARWWRRRPKQAAPPPPPRPPWETALAKLESLRRDGPSMVADGRANEFVDRVSDAVREYLGGRFGFDGLESTTDEVLSRLRDLHLGGGVTREEIGVLLGECDLVKFAKAEPDEQSCGNLVLQGIRIVRGTIPIVSQGVVVTPTGGRK